MYRFLKTGFIFILIFITGVTIAYISVSRSVNKDCLEEEISQEVSSLNI